MGRPTDANDEERIDLVETARKRAVITPAAEQAKFVISTIGARMATAAIGLREARTLQRWADGADVESEVRAQRLQELYQVVWALSQRYTPAVAAAFLSGTNPYLGDRSPLVVLAEEEPGSAGPAILTAARQLIES